MSDEEHIWQSLLNDIGNEYGVAALMGNLYAESGLNPKNLENAYEESLGYTDDSYTKAVSNGTYSKDNFINDRAGYGLAQWTFPSRKEALYNRFVTGGYNSIGELQLQINYLLYELHNDYPSVMQILKNATSIRVASNKVLHDFENPLDQSLSVEVYRESLGQGYYNKYATGSGGGTISSKKRKGYNFVLFNKRRRIYG
jgi:hypothetical protein